MGFCFHLNGTIIRIADEALNSKESINFWKGVLKDQSNPEHYKRFLRILANRRGLRVLPDRQ